ncbi:hypothetical protein P7H12_10605 [Paenibacillus larvae]|nr:hypothetical protein [Paenibacillus larvae]MDT2263954.1 hypothetical protein [Paenibacillus larvae]
MTSVNLMRNPATGLVSNGILRWLYSTRAAARLSGVIKKMEVRGRLNSLQKPPNKEVGRNDRKYNAADEYITANCRQDVQDWLESDTERKKINNRLGRYAFRRYSPHYTGQCGIRVCKCAFCQV